MTNKCDHITQVLARLHWLPVTARIHFKIALLTFKTPTTHQPSYIRDLLHPHCSSRPLRSSSHNLLEIPWMRTGFAQRSFTYSAPHIWNSLPHVITDNLDVTANTFKKKLKNFIALTATRRFTWPPAPAIRHLMTDIRHVKRCIVITIIISCLSIHLSICVCMCR